MAKAKAKKKVHLTSEDLLEHFKNAVSKELNSQEVRDIIQIDVCKTKDKQVFGYYSYIKNEVIYLVFGVFLFDDLGKPSGFARQPDAIGLPNNEQSREWISNILEHMSPPTDTVH